MEGWVRVPRFQDSVAWQGCVAVERRARQAGGVQQMRLLSAVWLTSAAAHTPVRLRVCSSLRCCPGLYT